MRVDSDETFALLGGNLNFEGATIKTAGGRIELGSVESNERVNLTSTNGSFNFDYEGVQNFRDIQLTQTATVDASGEGGGDIQVRGRNITLTDGSRIEASTLGSLPGGSLDIVASENVELSGFNSSLIDTGIFARVYSEASGTGGNISITTKNLNLLEGADINTNTLGEGNGGNFIIDASESVNISSFVEFSEIADTDVDADTAFSEINNSVESDATGNGGDLVIETKAISISGYASIGSSTFGIGNGGNTIIRASEFVDIQDTSVDAPFLTGIAAQSDPGATGNAGNITIETKSLDLNGGDTRLGASTFGDGSAGNLEIIVEKLLIENGAEVQTIAFANGDAGNLSIQASELVQVNGIVQTIITRTNELDGGELVTFPDARFGGIFASAIGGGTGDAGNLTIDTDRLIVQDFGTITTSNFQTLGLLTPGRGAAGNLEINANSVEVNNGTITAANANGEGGNLTLNANSLTLDNGGDILAETTADTGVGGNINLIVDDVVSLRDNSLISARATGNAIGGNIDIDADFVVGFPSQVPNDGNDLLADGQNNESGQIVIDADAVLGFEVGQETPGNGINDIDFFSNFEAPDTRNIQPPEIIDPDFETPEIVEAERVEAQACRGGESIASGDSSLIITGKGGTAPQPTDPLYSDAIIVDGQTTTPNLQSQHPEIKPIKTQYGDIIPARGVVKTQDGRVILTAYPTDNITRTPHISGNCS